MTRQDIEGMKAMDRPKVRCKYDADLVNQDGRVRHEIRETVGRIVVDGNNPWVEIWAAGRHHAERFSWDLVVEVLTNRFATPLWFNGRVEYEV